MRDDTDKASHDTAWACPKTRLRQFYSGCKIGFVAWILLALASHYITNLIK